jgi:hypothetical protein
MTTARNGGDRSWINRSGSGQPMVAAEINALTRPSTAGLARYHNSSALQVALGFQQHLAQPVEGGRFRVGPHAAADRLK